MASGLGLRVIIFYMKIIDDRSSMRYQRKRLRKPVDKATSDLLFRADGSSPTKEPFVMELASVEGWMPAKPAGGNLGFRV